MFASELAVMMDFEPVVSCSFAGFETIEGASEVSISTKPEDLLPEDAVLCHLAMGHSEATWSGS